MARPKAAPKDCCPLLTLVLGRARDTDRLGLSREPGWNLKTGRVSETLVLRFRKSKTGPRTRENEATYAIVNHCPFCGTKVKGAPRA